MTPAEHQPTGGVPFTTPEMAAIEAEIALARRELVATVDELAGRLTPRAQAQAAREAARRLVADATNPDAPVETRDRARKVLLGTAVGVALVTTLVAVRIARRHR